ncbi:MAG: hypothetical protein M3Z75_18520 [Actinomycetota bacterium]|nr:hypothetical protein [Actinomycetota bacterium]
MAHDDLTWAALSAIEGPLPVEWLEDSSCGPHVKAIAVRAVHARAKGLSAAQWRHGLLAEHPGVPALLA